MANIKYKTCDADTRMDIKTMIRALLYITNHVGVSEPQLRTITRLSRASNIRLLASTRKQFGVKIKYTRDPMHGGGEYSIDDWGILNPLKMAIFLKNRSRK